MQLADPRSHGSWFWSRCCPSPACLSHKSYFMCSLNQLSEHTVLESRERKRRKRKLGGCVCVCANFAGRKHTACCPFWAKRFMAFWPDVLPAEMAHGTKWGNLQDICAADEKDFFGASGSLAAEPRNWTHITRIGGIGHDFEPALKGGYLKEGQVSPADVVKLHVRVAPLSVILFEASRNVWDDFWIDRQAGSYVKALKLGEEGIMC